MEPDFNANNLPVILSSKDSGEVIKALQFLITNLYLANNTEISDCVKQLTLSPDVGVRFWAKKLSNSIGKYETEQANAQVAAISKDLPVDILIQKLQSVASTYLSLDVIKKLCESKKPEAEQFLKTYLSNCKDNIQISYLTKNIGIYFPSEENLLLLMPFLKHEDDRIVANTIEGIEAIGSSKGVIVLSQLLEHKSNRVRTNAAIALGKFDAEKSFAVISKMLTPEAGAHFRISACHAIKTLRDPRFLDQLEPALLDDTTFSAALESIAAIGGQSSIALLTDNYSRFSNDKQLQIDRVAAKLSRLEEKPLEKLGEKILASKVCAKANVFIDELKEKFSKHYFLTQPKTYLVLVLFIVGLIVFLYPSTPSKNITATNLQPNQPNTQNATPNINVNPVATAQNIATSAQTIIHAQSLTVSAQNVASNSTTNPTNASPDTTKKSFKEMQREQAEKDILECLENFRQGKKVEYRSKGKNLLLERLEANQPFTFDELRNESGWDKSAIEKELIGKKVLWQGWFKRIDYGDLNSDKYYCMIDMDPPEEGISVAEISLEVNEHLAKKFTKNAKIQFSGEISNSSCTMNWKIEFKNPRILSGVSNAVSKDFKTKSEILKLLEENEKNDADFVQQIKNKTSISYQEICDAYDNPDQKSSEKLDFSIIKLNHRLNGGKPLECERYNPNNESLSTRVTKNVIGKHVHWSGWVSRVRGGWLSDYGCEVDFDPPEQSFSTAEVEFNTTKDIADKLKRENKIEFEGTIRNVSGLLKPYITLDNNPRIINGLED